MAETEGFEPSVREYPVRRFSKPLVSATHPRLQRRLKRRGYSGRFSNLQPERSDGDHVDPHVEDCCLPWLKHAHAKLPPLLLRRIERGVGVGHRFGGEDAAGRRRIDLEEFRLE